MSAIPFTGQVVEDGSFTILGLITSRDGNGAPALNPTEGNLITQADLSDVTIAIYDPLGDTPETPLFTQSLDIATVIFDVLQTTGIWGLLSDGGNFLFDIPATWISNGGQVYRIQVRFTTTGGNISWGLWEAEVTELMGS
jgi:hypothetical protein